MVIFFVSGECAGAYAGTRTFFSDFFAFRKEPPNGGDIEAQSQWLRELCKAIASKERPGGGLLYYTPTILYYRQAG